MLTSRQRPLLFCAFSMLLLLGAKGCEKQDSDGSTDEAYGAGASGSASAGAAGAAGAAGVGGDGHTSSSATAGRHSGHSGGQAGQAGQATTAAGSSAGGTGGTAGSKGQTTAGGSAAAGAGGSPLAGAGGAGGEDAAGSAAGGGGAGTAGKAAPVARCGTRGGVSCADSEFCDLAQDSQCGANDRGGVCQAKPDVCPDLYEPVCGCDTRSYSNACEAQAAGVSVAHAALCTPDECVSIGGHTLASDGASVPQCAADEEQWNLSGGREQVICCLPKPPRGKTCGGIAALECGGTTQFCNYETAAGGQGCDGMVADAGGVCQEKPTACTREYQPVCGCDHRTYATACTAHSTGVSILHDGACTTVDCTAVGGTVAYGTGPGPMCPAGTTRYTDVIEEDGSIPIEGAYCCVK